MRLPHACSARTTRLQSVKCPALRRLVVGLGGNNILRLSLACRVSDWQVLQIDGAYSGRLVSYGDPRSSSEYEF